MRGDRTYDTYWWWVCERGEERMKQETYDYSSTVNMYKWWNDGWGMMELWDVNEIMVHDGCVDAVSIETRNKWILIALLVCTSKWSAQCITSSLVIPWGERWREGVKEGQQVFCSGCHVLLHVCHVVSFPQSPPPPSPVYIWLLVLLYTLILRSAGEQWKVLARLFSLPPIWRYTR